MRTSARVVLSLSASRSFDRGCLRGIARFLRIHGPWDIVQCEPPQLASEATAAAAAIGTQRLGVIGAVRQTDLTYPLSGGHLRPIIIDVGGEFCNRPRGQPLPSDVAVVVDIDPAAVAHAAANHFLERHFAHFAFCGRADSEQSEQCRDAFARYLGARNHAVAVFGKLDGAGVEDVAALVSWLKTLPRPLAVLACDDARGRQVIQACARADIAVPEEVSVLGIGDEPLICELSHPTLSSVRPDARAIGFRAATVLAEMMQGGPAPVGPLLVPPVGVVTRHSTELAAIEDPVVARAMHVIRAEAVHGLNVEELLQHLTVSRATLERRFTKALGHSPKDEILRLRLDRAGELLRETDYNLAQIATLCGFKTAAHLSVTFKAKFGVSPGHYRSSQANAQPTAD